MRRILHPLPEILFLVVCGTIADCDGYEDIAAWGAAHLDFLREHLPYAHGVPGERGDDRDARFTGAGLRIDTTTDAIQAHRARHQRSKPARARDAARRLGSRDPGAPACPRGRHARRVSR